MTRPRLRTIALNACLVAGVVGTWWIANKAYYEYGSVKASPGQVLFALRGRPPLYEPAWVPQAYYACWSVILAAGCGLAISHRVGQRRRVMSLGGQGTSRSASPARQTRAVRYTANPDTLLLLVRESSRHELLFVGISVLVIGWLVVHVPYTAMKWTFAAWALFWMPLVFLERRPPLFFAIEKGALVIGTSRQRKLKLRRMEIADIARVRLDSGAERGALIVELRTGERVAIYLSRRAQAAVSCFELGSNVTDVVFPPAPMRVELAAAAVSSILESIDIPVEQTRSSRVPFAWLFRK